MEKKEYLNEDWYKNTKKKMLGIALIIFGAGLLLGLSFVIVGQVRSSIAKKQYAEYKEILKQEVSSQIKSAKESLTKEIEEAKAEVEVEETKSTDTEKEEQIAKLKEEISKLEEEKKKAEENNDTLAAMQAQTKILELKMELDDLEDEEEAVESSTSGLDKAIQNELYNSLTKAVTSTNEENLEEAMKNPLFNKLFGTLGTKLDSTIEYTFTTGRFIGYYIIGCTLITMSAIASVIFYFVGLNVEVHKHTDKKEEKKEK